MAQQSSFQGSYNVPSAAKPYGGAASIFTPTYGDPYFDNKALNIMNNSTTLLGRDPWYQQQELNKVNEEYKRAREDQAKAQARAGTAVNQYTPMIASQADVPLSVGGIPAPTMAAAPQFWQSAEFEEISTLLRNLMDQFSPDRARADAKAAYEQRALAEREKSGATIRRAVEGAGTSASSMQALLDQNFNRDLAAGQAAAGTEAVGKYGGIQAAFANALASLTGAQGSQTTDILRTLLSGQTSRDVANTQAGGGANKYFVF